MRGIVQLADVIFETLIRDTIDVLNQISEKQGECYLCDILQINRTLSANMSPGPFCLVIHTPISIIAGGFDLCNVLKDYWFGVHGTV